MDKAKRIPRKLKKKIKSTLKARNVELNIIYKANKAGFIMETIKQDA